MHTIRRIPGKKHFGPCLAGAVLLGFVLLGCGERTLVEKGSPLVDEYSTLKIVTNQPSAIQLLTPTNQAALTSSNLSFTWLAGDSYQYSLTLSTNPDLSLPLHSSGDLGPATSYAYDLPTAYLEKTVYWRVEGVLSGTNTNRSATWQFVVSLPLAPLDIVISEVNYYGTRQNDPDDASAYGEFIELYNNTSRAVNISGFTILYTNADGTSTDTFTVPEDTIIQPGSFLVAGQGAATFLTVYLEEQFSYWQPSGMSIGNTGFSLTLLDSSGTRLDHINARPSASGFTAPGSNGEPKQSMERVASIGDGSLLANWSAAISSSNVHPDYDTNTLATPGTNNSIW